MDWKPISSAPRDATFVLVFEPGAEPFFDVAYWHPDESKWLDEENTWSCEPTHWMPLVGPTPTQEEKPK